MPIPETCPTGAITGAQASFILHPKAANELILPGIQTWQLPGWTTEQIIDNSIDLPMSVNIPGGKTVTPSVIMAKIMSREKTQETIRIYSEQGVRFNDIWIVYGENNDIWSPRLDLDPCTFCTLSDFAPQSVGKNDLLQFQFQLNPSAYSAFYDYHTPSVSYGIVDGVATITTGSDLVALGFEKDMALIFETGDQDNPLIYSSAAAVTATTITLSDLTIQLASGTGKIHGAVVTLPELQK